MGMVPVAGTNSASELSANYMQLLVTQLSHQDPTEPMSNEALTQQLATLSQLEQLEKVNNQFGELMKTQELTEAKSLIGLNIDFIPQELGERIQGTVTGVEVEGDRAFMKVGEFKVGLDEVLAVTPY